jgi:hypothetical protein
MRAAVAVLPVLSGFMAASCAPPPSGAEDVDSARGDAAAEIRPADFVIATGATLAARLSHFLWAGDGEAEIAARLAASAPATLTLDALGATTRWMLADPRARASVKQFYRTWLRSDDLASIPKDVDVDAGLRDALAAEPGETGAYVTLDADGSLVTLLTIPYTMVNQRLARHYDMNDVTGDVWQKHDVDTPRRVGLLSGAGVLSRFSSRYQPPWPAKRTWLLADALLCVSMPEPPFTASFVTNPQTSVRAQMIETTATGECPMCHYLLNEPGFAFLEFDTLGRFAPQATWGPFDTSGAFDDYLLAGAPSFATVADLMGMLSTRMEVRQCFARQWLAYARAADPTARPDDYTLRQLDATDVAQIASVVATASIKEVIVATTQTSTFAGP